ncbi:hypothetical protein HK104_005044 [Borealophlyctis nickersoniae]|nr:hypothetical protein HK104_005044 [Borealophlyctis nickersoniae]
MLAQWWKDFFPTESQFHSKAFTGPKSVLHELGEFLEKPQGNSDRILTPDTSVLLFVAVCRALDIETRLVASLHPVPLSLASNDKVYKKTVAGSKGKRKRGADDENNEEDAKQTPTLESEQQGSNSSASQKKRVVPAPDVYPFRFWCEVYVDKTEEWIPVDPVRGICNDTVAMEPPASAINQLQISYVVACEQGFGVKDVTRRYTSQWGARTIRLRLPQGDEGEGWWQQALWLYSKSDRTAKDTTEDAKLEEAVVREPMPKSLAAYNNHPVYALERHLKKYEIIHPSGRQHAVGVINNELIYPRQLVKELHTPEAWLKLGRKVKAGEEPIKFVKARASTINRKRQIEADKLDAQRGLQEEGLDPSRDASKSALYGEWQTEVFVAPPIVDGKIPRNSFGNIEIFHENMIPQGSVHLAAAGIGKLAKQLGIDYASAVNINPMISKKVGFEFRGGRSIPIINGIVVAEEFQEILLLAHDENRDHQMKLEAKKRQRRVVGRWRKIIFSLLTRDWIFREYGKKPEPAPLPDDEEEEEEGDFESDESGDEEGGYREGRGDDDDDDDDGDDDGRMQEAEDEWDEEMGPRVRRRRRPTSHAASEGSFSGDQARGGFLSEEVSGGGFIPDGESPQEGGFLVEDSD